MTLVKGTEAKDSLRGTLTQNIILGKGGDDTLSGLDDDVLSGGLSNDRRARVFLVLTAH